MSASSTPTFRPMAARREREIGGGGRFADAALARRHGDDRAHARHQRLLRVRLRPPGAVRRGPPACAARRLCASARPMTDSTPGSASTAFSAARRSGSSRGAALALDLDGEGDMAVAQLHARDHAEADDVLARARDRVTRAQRGEDLALGGRSCLLVLDFAPCCTYQENARHFAAYSDVALCKRAPCRAERTSACRGIKAAAPGAAGGGQSPWGRGAGRSRPTSRRCCAGARSALRRLLPRGWGAGAASCSSRRRRRRSLAGQRLLSRRARRAGRRAALRRLSTARHARAQLSSARGRSRRCCRPKVTRDNRVEIGFRASPNARSAAAPSDRAGRIADADRRREHRRHQLHRVLAYQGRRRPISSTSAIPTAR